MNSDILKGKWNQLQGQIRRQWGELTDDDVEVIKGDAQKLSGILQERYGYSREQAEREIDQYLRQYQV